MPKTVAVNDFDLDVAYSRKKLQHILRDIVHFRPNELARVLVRLAHTVESSAAMIELQRLEAASIGKTIEIKTEKK